MFIDISNNSFPIGNCYSEQQGLEEVEVRGDIPRLGYWLSEHHRGNGYMQEVILGIADAAISLREGIRALGAEVLCRNEVSQHMLEKCGFTYQTNVGNTNYYHLNL